MSNQHAIAVITRTKDRARLLARCIESLHSQSFEDWVHIIVNDGGSPSELEETVRQYAKRYGSRLKIIHHDTNRGMEAAANTGLRESRSLFVAFLDDDDTWDHQFLEVMISVLKRSREDEVKGVVCQTELVHEQHEAGEIRELRREPFNPQLTAIALDDLLVANRFTNNAFLFHRSALDEIGYFNENLPVLGDWDFNLRFLLRYEIVVESQLLARWHRRDESSLSADLNSPLALHKAWRVRLINDAIRGRWLGNSAHLALILVLGSKLDDMTRHQYDLDRTLRSSLDGIPRHQDDLYQALQSSLDGITRHQHDLYQALQSSLDGIARRQDELYRSLQMSLTQDIQQIRVAIGDNSEEIKRIIKESSILGRIRRKLSSAMRIFGRS